FRLRATMDRARHGCGTVRRLLAAGATDGAWPTAVSRPLTGTYILNDDGEPVPCDDLEIWGPWFERASRDGTRIVKQDFAEEQNTRVGWSTVFLGLDHSHGRPGPPILWESLIFGTSLDGEMDRYTSRAAALRGHDRMLARVREVYDVERQQPPSPRHKAGRR